MNPSEPQHDPAPVSARGMFQRFTNMARRAMVLAQETARRRQRDAIGTDDLLVALAHDAPAVSAQALSRLGVCGPDISRRIARTAGHVSPSHIPLAAETKEVLFAALDEAIRTGVGHISTGHLLLALVATGQGEGARIAGELGLTYEGTKAVLETLPMTEVVPAA